MTRIEAIDARDRAACAERMRALSESREGRVWFFGRDVVSGYLLIDGDAVEQEVGYLMNDRYRFDVVEAFAF